MPPALGRRLLAEAIGTALLVVFGPGSVVAALTVGRGSLDYAGLGMIGLSSTTSRPPRTAPAVCAPT